MLDVLAIKTLRHAMILQGILTLFLVLVIRHTFVALTQIQVVLGIRLQIVLEIQHIPMVLQQMEIHGASDPTPLGILHI